MGNIDKGFEMKNQYISQAKSWLSPMRIINVFLIIGACVLLGLTDFAEFKFDIESLKQGGWWVQTITKAVAYAMVFFSSSSTRTQNLIASDTDYLVLCAYVSWVARKSRSAFLNIFLLDYNLNRKKQVYKENVDKALDRLEKKADTNCLLAWREHQKGVVNQLVPLGVSMRSKRAIKKAKKYVDKKMYLLSIRDDKYIDENIDILKVDYYEVKEWQLKSGRNRNRSDENPLADSGELQRGVKTAGVIFRVIMIGALLSSVGYDIIQQENLLGGFISLAFTILMVMWNALSGNFDGKENFENHVKYKMAFRFSLFKDYVDYEKNTNKYDIPPIDS